MDLRSEQRVRIAISGVVQGVGFRPFVHRLATDLGLSGWVENDEHGVLLEAQGTESALGSFVERLSADAPPLARIDAIDRQDIAPGAGTGFDIRVTTVGGVGTVLVSPDMATCDDCVRELGDPTDRRYRYPFVNCTNCGPRYSIVTRIPYDRPNTTMSGFELCNLCAAEYSDPLDRRFHAQPVCCPDCGPQLTATIDEAVNAVLRGEIVALKGLGGYHLVARATDDAAVSRLRERKHREDKPFALMAPDLAHVEQLCRISAAELELLVSVERPIVLLERRPDARIADAVAPSTNELGVMLPYTPLHHLLLERLGEVIVCTSANLSDEPIAYRDGEARSRLTGVADTFVGHDRPINIRVDDSVFRVIDGEPYPIRRSRGYAPGPIRVAESAPRPILACGAELKNTIAYARGNHVFPSHHIGDLTTLRAHESFFEAIDHLGRLLEIEPQVIASDLHPDYLSSQYAAERTDLVSTRVQHHHAHVASCLADAGHHGEAIGVAFDGIGLGEDGTIWGGEFLVADTVGFRRAGWFDPVPMPGGDAATRHPWRMAASYLDRADAADDGGLAIVERNPNWRSVVEIGRSGVNSPPTSSVGRLFDAVAALVGVRDQINYEGQAAIELEQIVDSSDQVVPTASIRAHGDGHVVAGVDLVMAALEDVRRSTPVSTIAMRFHRGLADAVVRMCRRIRDDTGLTTVALTGGVFLNRVLLAEAVRLLEAADFTVLRHRQVPCNDGGVSFGQAVVAAARDRAALLDTG